MINMQAQMILTLHLKISRSPTSRGCHIYQL